MARLDRNSSICHPPEDVLLKSVLKNDSATIKSVLSEHKNLLNYTYPFPYGKSILFIACSEDGVKAETVETLIDIDPNLLDKIEDHTPLIIASLNQNSDILKVILKKLKPGKINETNNLGNHALLELVKSNEVESDEEKFIEHVELLLRNGIDVNKTDKRNMSSILWATKKGLKQVMTTILEKSIAHVDLDSHKYPEGNKSARDFIKENNLYKHALLPEKMTTPSLTTIEKLFFLIKQKKQTEFISTLQSLSNTSGIINEDDGTSTLLQYSCEKGLREIVEVLINNHVNVNKTTKCTTTSPIELAMHNGEHEIFNLLLNEEMINLSPEILPFLIKYQADREQCFNILLEKFEKVNSFRRFINCKDSRGNTPLHYAVRYADPTITQTLLRLGASLACKNSFDRLDVEDMDPEILESHLNQCVQLQEKNQVRFDFSSLIPPQSIIKARVKSSDSDSTLGENTPFKHDQEKGIYPKTELHAETEVIAFLSRAKEFKHLLIHPLIVTFLFMKWHKICHIYYTNFFFYIAFVASLLAYIFTRYLYPENDDLSSWGVLFQAVLIFCFVVLMIRETFQIVVSPWNYFKSLENYIEIVLIIITGLILFLPSSPEATRKVLASLAILLAALALFLMVGHHPKQSTYVVMFETVSANFFELLLWYSLLIAAFALSFSILLKKNESDSVDQFSGAGQSIFKTIVMLTGEFDYASINFETYPIWSKLIFFIFVFIFTIILLNLLNGLAVSDTQSIKNDAELVGHISRAQHIHYVENMVWGNILPSSILKFLNNFCCCINPATVKSFVRVKWLGEKICLFRESQKLFVNSKTGEIKLDGVEETKLDKCCVGDCMRLKLDKDTLKRTNAIIKERDRDEKAKKDQITFEEMKKKLDKVMEVLLPMNSMNSCPAPMASNAQK